MKSKKRGSISTRSLGPPPPPSSEAISKVMKANVPRGTQPELMVRMALRKIGLPRYRLNWKGSPGRPDIAYPGLRIAIFIHGCFWHRCPRCRPPLPKTHTDFWRRKFKLNKERDRKKREALEKRGWKVFEFWECEVRENADKCAGRIKSQVEKISMPDDYDKEVLDEGGFKVELSNRGEKLKFNPNPQNLKKKLVKCKYPGCHIMTKTIFGLCTKHNTSDGRRKIKHTKDWIGRIIPSGYSKEQCLTDAPSHSQTTEILVKWMNDREERKKIMDDFIDDVLGNIVGNAPDASILQMNLDGKIENVMTPSDMIEVCRRLVDKHFPKGKYEKVKLQGGSFRGKSLNDIPIRVVAALLIIAYACEESNRGDAWFCRINNRVSKYGNAYMPSVYYFLRRYTKATENQARMCLK